MMFCVAMIKWWKPGTFSWSRKVSKEEQRVVLANDVEHVQLMSGCVRRLNYKLDNMVVNAQAQTFDNN